MGDRLASGSGRQPRPRGQRRQSRAGQPGVGGREATTDRATAEAMTRSEEGCGTTAAALGRQQPGARGGLCIRTPLGRRHCAVKIEPLGDRAAADGSRNFTFMGSDYPLTRSSRIKIGSSHVQTGVVRVEEEGEQLGKVSALSDRSISTWWRGTVALAHGVALREPSGWYAESRFSSSVRACWWRVAVVVAAVAMAAAAVRPRQQRQAQLRQVRQA